MSSGAEKGAGSTLTSLNFLVAGCPPFREDYVPQKCLLGDSHSDAFSEEFARRSVFYFSVFFSTFIVFLFLPFS